MLTGDNKTTAQAVARMLGIDEIEETSYQRTNTASSKSLSQRAASSRWLVTA